MKNILKKIIVGILIFESKLILKKYSPKIIAVTGSVGKTSTKDAIYTALKDHLHVRKNEKSYNSEIGVPLTIIGVDNAWGDPVGWISNILHGLDLIFSKADYPEWLVLEVGADHPGDIRNIASWLAPDIAIITKVGDVPVHVEFFPTPKDLLLEKAELLKGMKKNGTAVLLHDEEKVRNLPETLGLKESHPNAKIVTFGMGNEASMSVSDVDFEYEDGRPVGMHFKLNWEGNSVPMSIKGCLGLQHVYPVLTAILIAKEVGVSPTKAIQSIASHIAPKGRMNIIEGINQSVIIDDSYNASPDAVHEALKVVAGIQTSFIKRKIAVLGDMMELGKFSVGEHIEAGRAVYELIGMDSKGANGGILITVGQRALGIAEGALGAGMDKRRIYSYTNSREAGGMLRSMVQAGDLILVKGSQSARMERVSESLLAEPSRAGELLVRQEKEWKIKA